jgi:predicted phosphodiesterase
MGWLIAIAFGLLVLSNGDASTEDKEVVSSKIESKEIKDNLKIENTKKLPHYNAEEIFCYLSDNLWDADKCDDMLNKLKDTDIKISGTVHHARANNIDGTYVVFRQLRADGLTDGWCMIICYFYDDKQKEKAMQLEKGYKVTIIGHTCKYPLAGISLYDCYLQ